MQRAPGVSAPTGAGGPVGAAAATLLSAGGSAGPSEIGMGEATPSWERSFGMGPWVRSFGPQRGQHQQLSQQGQSDFIGINTLAL